jgi:hypothetical protein
MTNNFKKRTDEDIAALPEILREMYIARHLTTGVNARVLHGVNVAKLKTLRFDGLNDFPGEYGTA